MAKSFSELTECEVLALAIKLEEEDGRAYGDIADALRGNYPGTATVFEKMRGEESEHRRRLSELYREKFGDDLHPIRRQDVKGFVDRQPMWWVKNLSIENVRKQAASMETETRAFYEEAAGKTHDVRIRSLLMDLAEEEREHASTAESLSEEFTSQAVKDSEGEKEKRLFLMQIIQPGLAGLMDGSVSTLAPIFAAAVTAHLHHADGDMSAFKVGLAASIGAGISMGFAEALSDDGKLTGRGRPLIRGIACGLMTTAGGIGHTLPFMISDFNLAFWLAILVVVIELAVISWIRHRYMQSPWVIAAIQVVIGGIVVLLAGIFIGAG